MSLRGTSFLIAAKADSTLKNMKQIFSLFFCFFSFSVLASNEKYEPTSLFECRPNEGDWIDISLHRRIQGIGPQKFVAKKSYQDAHGKIITHITRMNLTEYYDGRIVFFTGSDLRLRFNRMNIVDQKMKTFAQIPSLNIYNEDWSCKGPSFADLPDLKK